MFNIPFWVMIGVFVIMAAVAIKVKGFSFVDSQVVIASIAVALFFDMVFCKWLNFYGYVTKEDLNAFYSLIFCVIGYPAIGLAFYKLLPRTRIGIILSFVVWTIVLTLSEIYLAKPFGIVIYEKWIIIPYSPVIYVIALSWEYGYYKVMEKHWKALKA